MANQQETPGEGGAIAIRDNSEVGLFQRQLESRARDIQMALPAGISAGKFQRTVLTAVAQNPDLLKADRGSLILACYKAAQDGLVPDGREAALVTFNNRVKLGGDWKSVQIVQYMPMVYGLRKKILQAQDAGGSPIVAALQVGVVYRVEVEKGYFLWERGSDPEVQHRPMLEITAEEAGDENIVAAYSIATMANGTRSCEVMRRFEIDQVRQTSKTGALGQKVKFGNDKGKEIPPKGPWVDWFAEMAKKTVMRRHAKTLPMSGDVIAELGGEDENYAASAALTLGSRGPDEPQLITDESGDHIDPETGEVVSESGGQAGEPAEENAEDKKTTSRGRGKANPDKEAEPEKAAEPEAFAQGAGEDPGRDELGITKEPAEAKADEILDRFSKAELLPDLQKIYTETALDREAMPDEIHAAIEASYNRHHARLAKRPTAAAEPEHAK